MPLSRRDGYWTMKMKKTNLTRRTFIGGSAAASAGLLLRGLATGIPPALLLNPHKALGQGANMRRQTLIMSVSQAGDPVNINCPGSYINDAPRTFANNPLLTAVNGNFGGQNVRTAQPWAALPNALRRRLAFFHLKTFAAAHTEFDQTLTLRGAVKRQPVMGAKCFHRWLPSSTRPTSARFSKSRCCSLAQGSLMRSTHPGHKTNSD